MGRVPHKKEDMRLVQSTNKFGIDAHLHDDEPETRDVAQEDFQVSVDEEVHVFAFNIVSSGTQGKGSSSVPNDSASEFFVMVERTDNSGSYTCAVNNIGIAVSSGICVIS